MEHPVGFIPLLVYKLFRLVVMSRDSFTLANFSELDNLIIVNTSVQDLNVLRRNTMWSARNSNSMLNLKVCLIWQHCKIGPNLGLAFQNLTQ